MICFVKCWFCLVGGFECLGFVWLLSIVVCFVGGFYCCVSLNVVLCVDCIAGDVVRYCGGLFISC